MNDTHKSIQDQLAQIEALAASLREQLKEAKAEQKEVRVLQDPGGLALYLGNEKIPVNLDVSYEGDQAHLSFSIHIDEIERVATQRFCPVPAMVVFPKELSIDDHTLDFHTRKNESHRLPSDALWEGEFSH